jgi:cell division protein FtsI (penicillin-binding protein 3)
MTRKGIDERLAAVCAGFIFIFAVLWIRCVYLQVLCGSKFSKLAHAQHKVSRQLIPKRGSIYDSEGRVLAMSVIAPSVFANPRQVSSKGEMSVQLASLLDKNRNFVSQRLSKDKGFVWMARQVDPAMREKLSPFRKKGISFVEEAKRQYPQGRIAGHILGYVDIDHRGLEGMELSYNGILQGSPGWQHTIRDAKGDLLIGPWTVDVDPKPGLDMVLTIDSVVQAAAEEALRWGVDKFHAKGGSVIVLEPSSGRVLALANEPSFDPNDPASVSADSRRNRAVTDLTEPGSVFKIITAAALLEEGLVSPDERVFCEEGKWHTVARHILHDHRPHGWLNFHDVIMYSSNIGTAKFAQRLKPEVLYRYIRSFGFGQKTGIEMPGEVRGMIAPPKRWSKLSPYIIPIGQEVAVTPIQLACMVSVVANGGWKIKPHILERIQDSKGNVLREYVFPPSSQILSPDTVTKLHDMLVSVVESGTGQLAKVQGLTVAGKTGTAQKLEPAGHYSHSRFVASFVGFGPVPDPRFVIVVSIDEPRPLYFGGVVSAPVFKRIVEKLKSYWELSPEPAQLKRIAAAQ